MKPLHTQPVCACTIATTVIILAVLYVYYTIVAFSIVDTPC